jgi:steroid delta-isomerase-like uncharacterized protein
MSARDAIRQALEAYNRHDAAAVADVFSEDAVVHDPQYPEPLRGKEAIRNDMEAWIRTAPDGKGEIRSLLVEGDTYAFEITMIGTHQGPISTPSGDIEPTGKRIETSLAAFGTIGNDGKIVEERRYYDLVGLAAQLGVTR